MATRILLVDDEPLQRKATRLYLEDSGYAVDVAGGADEAVRVARAARPDLIVSDVLMSGVDGFGLCRRLQDDTLLGTIPVVLVSSHYGREDVELARAVGAQTLVERTPDFSAELTAVRSCLASRALTRPQRRDPAAYEQHLRANAIQLSRLDERARRADERFRTLLDEAHDAIAILTPDGLVLDANRRWQDLLGIDPSDMIGLHVADLAPDGHQARNTAMFLAAVGGGARADVVPLRHQKTGDIVHFEFSMRAVELADGAQVMAIGRDVTAQVQATRKLVETEAMYRSLVEQIPDIVWRMNGDGTVEFISPNCTRMTGLSPEAIHAKGFELWRAHVHADDREQLDAAFAAALAGEASTEVEYRFRTPDGRLLWLHTRGKVSRNGEHITYEGLTADITTRHTLEQSLAQAQKMEAIGQLTGGIAHDFNNLLAVILANSTFLLEQLAEGDPRRADATEIEHAAERAASLTRQLLAFSRAQPVDLHPIAPGKVIAGLEKLLRRLIGEDITLTVRGGEDAGYARADVGQLEQVVVNLVVNARDAMPSGGTIELASSAVELGAGDPSGLPAGPYVRITVVDSGSGMSADTLRRIFEPFFTTKERGYGTGLGLATCYGIVRHVGGYIGATSELGIGTEFTVLLPRIPWDGDAPIVEAKEDARGTETVLVIEDDSAVRAGIGRILRRRGYEVLLAADEAEAIERASECGGRFDLVVSDVVLPGASGPEVIDRLRELTPGVRALLISGYTDHRRLRAALGGDLELLHKPFSSSALARKVREVLDLGGARA